MNVKMLEVFEFAEKRFRSDYREFLSYFPADKLDKSLISYMELNTKDEIAGFTSYDLKAMRELLERTLATLIDNGALVPVAELSPEAQADLSRLRKSTGIGVSSLPPDPPKPKSADEILREEILQDWRTLPMSRIRLKKNSDRKYSAMLDRMAATGQFDSVVSSRIDLGTS